MNFVRGILLLVVAIGAMAWLMRGHDAASPPTQQVAAPVFDPQIALDDGLAIEAQWQKAKAGIAGAEPPDPNRVDKVDRAIGEIPLDWPKSEEAIALVKRLRAARPEIVKAHDAMMAAYAKKIRAQTEAENLAARKAYPKKAEKVFLDAGKDFYLTVEGKELRTLRIRYVLMSRPLVHQLTNSAKVVDTWRDIGFRKVIFTDGYNSTWTWSLE